ncbi:hypothetical protein J4408_03705 [Candidatus Pacearchaeota archaeon]|nr:hypothetical protein [Candidatus Pacearchaeota archaeon]
METIKNTPEKIVLKVPANESLANAIRRSVSEVPSLAIVEVEIFKNDSALYDEVLAHRLGLVPLKTEKSMDEKTKIDLKLTKLGPGTVYSGDLKGSADIVFDKIPLTILGEGGKIELIATAQLGTGLTHAKHIPGLCYYRNVLEVKSSPQIDKIVTNSSFSQIKAEKKGSKWTCDLNEAEIDEITLIDKTAVIDTNELILIVESYGNMPAKDILLGAVEVLGSNLEEVEKAFK